MIIQVKKQINPECNEWANQNEDFTKRFPKKLFFSVKLVYKSQCV